jgi:hypothetical protein
MGRAPAPMNPWAFATKEPMDGSRQSRLRAHGSPAGPVLVCPGRLNMAFA